MAILVAEDNATNREVIVQQLQLIGFSASVAFDGRQALERWRSGAFALLLTDLHMPEMDGFALAAAIRAEELESSRIPIVALTADALRDVESRCRAAGIDGYLLKPVRLAQLREQIERWLGPAAPAASDDAAAAELANDRSGEQAADLAVLAALVGDDRAVIEQVLQTFRASCTQASAQLRRAIDAGSAKDAADAAHRLKSAALSIGANRLGRVCVQIERAAELPDDGLAQLAALLPQFEIQLDGVRRFLESNLQHSG